MEASELVAFLGVLALLLLVGRAAGEVARRAGQPEVLGALAAGVLLGPSVLGAVWPSLQHALHTGEQNGTALAGVSNLAAVLLLLIAGLEVDLRLLRRELRPGLWVAAMAIVPSVLAGVLFGPWLGVGDQRAALYLGVVLSVTAVSVVSVLLIEAGENRRRYAQVILAGGVATEVACWVLVSAAASKSGSPLLSGARSLLLAAAVFVSAYAVGARVVPAVMRFAADRSRIADAPVTAVVVLTLAAGTGTAALGLHPLLGAFIVGILLSRSPRTNTALLTRIQSLTLGVFAPIFFVLAGSRVDLSQIINRTAALQMLALLAVATLVKVLPVALGARLGGLRGAEAWLVAAGMSVKGGTDVLVAILGQQLGVISVQTYTEYAIVSLITVLATPSVLRALRHRVAMSPEERQRLAHEEADRRSYLPAIERVLIPFVPELRPSLPADVFDRLARIADARDRLVDVTQLHIPGADDEESVGHGLSTLASTSEIGSVRLRQLRTTQPGDVVEEVLQAARGHDLLALGAPLDADVPGALSPLQNRLVDAAQPDVLLVAGRDHALPWDRIKRILVPTNGTPQARAAAEIAAYLAKSCNAELVLLHVVNPQLKQALDRRRTAVKQSPAIAHLRELRFLLAPLHVQIDEEIRIGDPVEQLRAELREKSYDLVVMGAVDQPNDGVAVMGSTVEVVIAQHQIPYVLLITHTSDSASRADR